MSMAMPSARSTTSTPSTAIFDRPPLETAPSTPGGPSAATGPDLPCRDDDVAADAAAGSLILQEGYLGWEMPDGDGTHRRDALNSAEQQVSTADLRARPLLASDPPDQLKCLAKRIDAHSL